MEVNICTRQSSVIYEQSWTRMQCKWWFTFKFLFSLELDLTGCEKPVIALLDVRLVSSGPTPESCAMDSTLPALFFYFVFADIVAFFVYF